MKVRQNCGTWLKGCILTLIVTALISCGSSSSSSGGGGNGGDGDGTPTDEPPTSVTSTDAPPIDETSTDEPTDAPPTVSINCSEEGENSNFICQELELNFAPGERVYALPFYAMEGWTMVVEESMRLKTIEIDSNIYAFPISSKPEWKNAVDQRVLLNDEIIYNGGASNESKVTVDVDMFLFKGDVITYYPHNPCISGGCSSESVGYIYGDNSIYFKGEKLDYPLLRISSEKFQHPVDELNIVETIPFNGETPVGIAHDGENLLIIDTDKQIHHVASNGDILNSFESLSNYSPSGMTVIDGSIYITETNHQTMSRDSYIRNLDSEGNSISSFSIVPYPGGLTYDGEFFWYIVHSMYTAEPHSIRKVDLEGNSIDIVDVECDDPTGLTFDGTNFWYSDDGTNEICKLNEQGVKLACYPSPGSTPDGMAFDGTYLWNVDSGTNTIYKFELPKDVSLGQSISKTFTITNRGETDLVISSFSIGGTDPEHFIVQNSDCLDEAIAPMETCTFDIVFTPLSSGVKNAVLEIASNDPITPQLNVPLSGEDAIPTAETE